MNRLIMTCVPAGGAFQGAGRRGWRRHHFGGGDRRSSAGLLLQAAAERYQHSQPLQKNLTPPIEPPSKATLQIT